jgi:GPH family glycoside/pentoside/hexuronide:cation symporter
MSFKKLGDTIQDEIIPTKSKLAFGGATIASSILSGLGLGPITYYYNYILGLESYLTGLAWILFIVWNAFNDPLFGFLEDRTKSEKYGRRVPYIRFGAPIYSILFMLCWFPLVNINNQVALFFNYLIILYAFDTIFTIVGLITFSLPAEMAISSKARASIMIFGSIFGALGSVFTFLIPALLLTAEDAPPLEIFLATMVILGIICGIILFISSYYLKENKYTQLEEPLGYWKGLLQSFKNKPFLIFEASNFFFTIAEYTLSTGIFYYIDFVLNLGGLITMIPLAIFFGIVFSFTIVYNKILSKIELKKVYLGIQLLTGLSFFLFFGIGWTLITAIIGMILLGIGFSGLFMTRQIVMADIIDYDEVLTKKRRETSYSGVNALITKPAVSIAPWLFLLIIDSFGFINKKGATQPQSVPLGIMIAFTIIPATLILISALLFRLFPLYGSEWREEKEKLYKIHQEKEEVYLDYLRRKKNQRYRD